MPMGKIYQAPSRGLSNKQKKQVKSIVNSQKDMKQFFQSFLQTPLSGTAEIDDLTLVAKGDAFNQRSEDTIQALSLKVNFCLANNATGTRQVFRILIVRAKNIPLVLADVPTVTATPNYEKMQVYYDKTFFCDTAEHTTFQSFEKKLNFKKKQIPYMKIGYDESVSATIPQRNGIYIMSCSSEASNAPAIQGTASLKFYNTI